MEGGGGGGDMFKKKETLLYSKIYRIITQFRVYIRNYLVNYFS